MCTDAYARSIRNYWTRAGLVLVKIWIALRTACSEFPPAFIHALSRHDISKNRPLRNSPFVHPLFITFHPARIRTLVTHFEGFVASVVTTDFVGRPISEGIDSSAEQPKTNGEDTRLSCHLCAGRDLRLPNSIFLRCQILLPLLKSFFLKKKE